MKYNNPKFSLNPRAKGIINQAIKRANAQFNPSLNQDVEELSGEPSDRTDYDYAGTKMETTNI